jgi:hypothetical protein
VTHVRQYSESEGDFEEPEPCILPCVRCKSTEHHTIQIWNSADGAYEDEKHSCSACGHVWWVDGIDS